MSIVKSVKARDLKVHMIEAADLPTLQTALQDWLDSREEEVIISIDFDNAGSSSDNRVYILYTE